MVTRQGVIKRTLLSEYEIQRKGGKIAINLDEGDELIFAAHTHGDTDIMVATSTGLAARFPEEKVSVMGRTAHGVRGIKLNEGDYLVDVACDSDGSQVLTVTDNGYGKITPTEDYTEHHRGSTGVTGHAVTDKTGPVKAIMCVNGDEDVMMIASNGVIIRTGVEAIRVCGRASQGVRLMRLSDDVKIISITRALKEDEEDVSEIAETAENTEVTETVEE